MNKLYISNISYEASESELQSLFAPYGKIKEVKIIYETKVIRGEKRRRSKGFGFVEFETSAEAQLGLGLNGFDFMGRELFVTVADARSSQAAQRAAAGAGGGAQVKTMQDRTRFEVRCANCGQKHEHVCKEGLVENGTE